MSKSARGFTLLELVIGVAILGTLLAIGAASFSSWIKNAQIRTAAEALQNGLQLARGEAVRRNTWIRFQLTSSTDANCAVSADATATATNWVVSFDDPSLAVGKCAHAVINDAFPETDSTNNPPPRIIQARPAAEGSRDVLAVADQSVITFNGLGRITPASVNNPVKIDISNPSGGDCTKVRCLRVTVSTGGQVRICDPSFPSAGNDPQRC